MIHKYSDIPSQILRGPDGFKLKGHTSGICIGDYILVHNHLIYKVLDKNFNLKEFAPLGHPDKETPYGYCVFSIYYTYDHVVKLPEEIECVKVGTGKYCSGKIRCEDCPIRLLCDRR